jgi:hypothetical protein
MFEDYKTEAEGFRKEIYGSLTLEFCSSSGAAEDTILLSLSFNYYGTVNGIFELFLLTTPRLSRNLALL